MARAVARPGVQRRFTDADGMCLTCCATNTKILPIAALELDGVPAHGVRDRLMWRPKTWTPPGAVEAAGGIYVRPPAP
ncbi:hypothetical protein GCM10011579_065790 [Streptomyces albiflavescens]|uniref:Uncharacterized protein n=1 Tax=Streptomyces albiflavescens TaxID=1623582 RepID=A0A917YBK8_9ACTN|nr:hypothetical protein GCM10011579_065790 [Streptomyces albiflavescens]